MSQTIQRFGYTIQQFGCLKIDGQIYSPSGEYEAGVISIGDSSLADVDTILSWLPFEDKFVSNQVNLTSVSWEDLHTQALDRGRVINIDGKPYLCRSISTTRKNDSPSEWERFVALYKGRDPVIHWRGKYTWGQEREHDLDEFSTHVAAYGWKNAGHKKFFPAGSRTPGIGFRPVLVPLAPSLEPEKVQKGAWVTLHLTNGIVASKILDVTQYDIILSGRLKYKTADYFSSCLMVDYDKGVFIVNRSAVCYVQRGWTPN